MFAAWNEEKIVPNGYADLTRILVAMRVNVGGRGGPQLTTSRRTNVGLVDDTVLSRPGQKRTQSYPGPGIGRRTSDSRT